MGERAKKPDRKAMRKGTVFVLHRNTSPSLPKHRPDEFVLVRIREARVVYGNYGGGPYWGHRAEDREGHNYFCNWGSFPEDSMSPMWWWYSEHRPGNDSWHEVTNSLTIYRIHRRPIWLKGRFARVIGHCKKHGQLFYKRAAKYQDGHGCHECYLRATYPQSYEEKEKTDGTPWNGWY